jgi:hypothetical protein
VNVLAIKRSDECLVQFGEHGVSQIIADMFDSLDFRSLFVARLVIIKKIDQSVRSGNEIPGDIRKHREKGGVLAHEAKHFWISAPFRRGLVAVVQSSSISHLLGRESTPLVRQELAVALVEDSKSKSSVVCPQQKFAGPSESVSSEVFLANVGINQFSEAAEPHASDYSLIDAESLRR